MKLKARISWLMETVQQSLFPHLDECLPMPFTEQEQRLVKILELIKIEQYVTNKADRQWLGRPIKERESIARAFIAKASCFRICCPVKTGFTVQIKRIVHL